MRPEDNNERPLTFTGVCGTREGPEGDVVYCKCGSLVLPALRPEVLLKIHLTLSHGKGVEGNLVDDTPATKTARGRYAHHTPQ